MKEKHRAQVRTKLASYKRETYMNTNQGEFFPAESRRFQRGTWAVLSVGRWKPLDVLQTSAAGRVIFFLSKLVLRDIICRIQVQGYIFSLNYILCIIWQMCRDRTIWKARTGLTDFLIIVWMSHLLGNCALFCTAVACLCWVLEYQE